MSERKTEGKDHKEDDDEEDLEDPDLKVKAREHGPYRVGVSVCRLGRQRSNNNNRQMLCGFDR